MSNATSREQLGAELARLCVRLDLLKEEKKERSAESALEIKSCEKEIRRLALELRTPETLFAIKES